MRKCNQCKSKYEPRTKWQLYCDVLCKRQAYKRPQPRARLCVGCNREFTPKVRSDTIYCSPRCGTLDWRRRGVNKKKTIISASDTFSRRWDILWKLADPDLQEKMRKIEMRLPLI